MRWSTLCVSFFKREGEKCYYLFLVAIYWQGDIISTGGTAILRAQLPLSAQWKLPDFGGSIAKVCFCEDDEDIKKIKDALRATFPSGGSAGNLNPVSVGDTTVVTGYELTARDCDCGGFFTRSKCVGNEEFEILGPGGQPLNINTGSWVTSTGDTRQFPGGHKKDILQDIINTELANSLPCCAKDKKSNSSSTSLGN